MKSEDYNSHDPALLKSFVLIERCLAAEITHCVIKLYLKI